MSTGMGRFRQVLGRMVDGWNAASKPPPPTGDRFVMKAGEVTIIRGGGARIDRSPSESRDAD